MTQHKKKIKMRYNEPKQTESPSEDHVSRIKDIINLKKRRLREIDEELLELNLANKITLSDDVIDTLREFEIV